MTGSLSTGRDCEAAFDEHRDQYTAVIFVVDPDRRMAVDADLFDVALELTTSERRRDPTEGQLGTATQRAEVGDPDEMYLLGLMHNIGELFLLRVFGELFQRHNNQVLSMNDVLNVIREWHCVFGEGLMKKWDMGDTFSKVARRHHDMEAFRSDELDPQVIKLMHVVNLGDQLTEVAGVTYYAKSLPGPSIQDSYEALGCPMDQRDALRIAAEEMRDELKAEGG